MGVTMAVCASAVSAAVAFGVRGIPATEDSHGRWVFLFLLGACALGGLLGASRIPHISEVRTFETAVPLNDPEAVLPGDDTVRHHLVDRSSFLLFLVPSLIAALFWSPWAALYPLPLSAEWLVRACVAARWERRHGLLLWGGAVKEQPLGKGQLLYSSVRPVSPTR
ncbi:hypothetical protein [Streptomyces lushanensis]|uniref:hypothetical protein n=1 Tax=Streptomyces lushanensis TaxID=1434255 RepID=UPI00114CE62E|nr:hypothetical protein [Streptomyces lushanensis]